MKLLRSDNNTVYLINCVDKGTFLQAGFVYAETQPTDQVTVSDGANTFVITLPESLKGVTGYATGVNFKFNYGN